MRAAAMLLLAGCLHTELVICGDRACPAGTVCDDAHASCASPGQVTACNGAVDGTPCAVDRQIEAGTCDRGVCIAAGCGSRVVDAGEVCDDGNQIDGDGCSHDCRSDERCGNGLIDLGFGEVCDDGNSTSFDGCGECSAEAPTWTEVTDRFRASNRSETALVYDAARGTVLMFGGSAGIPLGDTWEWDGAKWLLRAPVPRPPARYGHASAYDGKRRTIVIFGGNNGADLGDTWEWDGRWHLASPTVSPPPRVRPGMAYDGARHELVLFGGANGVTSLDETWTYDGVTWTKHQVAGPPKRSAARMAYDPVRGRVVLHGGSDAMALRDTWEWDGASWTMVASNGPAVGISGGTLFYDGACGCIALVAGTAVWNLNGATWTPRGNLANTVSNAVFDFSRGTILAIEGGATIRTFRGTGVSWPEVVPSPLPPSSSPAIAYDPLRGRIVTFGGPLWPYALSSDTWEWDGLRWIQQTAATGPGGLEYASAAFDDTRRQVILFGGFDGTIYNNDTWAWTGATWTLLSSTGPSPRKSVAMSAAPDHRVLLFGGYDGQYHAGTWIWDGAQWTDAQPVHTPPARGVAAMAYDRARNRVVLFGGYGTSSNQLNDTWTWDGTDWTNVVTASSPEPRSAISMAYDETLQKIVLFGGGSSAATAFDDTWVFDGANWEPVFPTAPQPAGSGVVLAYDSIRHQTIAFGGTGAGPRNTTFAFRFDNANPHEVCTSGFDLDGDSAIGCADTDCRGACMPLCPLLTSCDASAPHCGDGTCSMIEDCHSCPADCAPCAACGDGLCEGGETLASCPGDCTP